MSEDGSGAGAFCGPGQERNSFGAETIGARKKALRHDFRERRAAYPPLRALSECLQVNRSLALFIAERLENRRDSGVPPLRVGAYMAEGDELSLEPLLEDELNAAQEVGLLEFYIPKTMRDKQGELYLRFGRYVPAFMRADGTPSACACQKGALGIWEPSDAQLWPDLRPDLLLIPCLAVDARGVRLGQGGGCYDRYLAELKALDCHPETLALGYGCQFSAAPLPSAEHDVRMGYRLLGGMEEAERNRD